MSSALHLMKVAAWAVRCDTMEKKNPKVVFIRVFFVICDSEKIYGQIQDDSKLR